MHGFIFFLAYLFTLSPVNHSEFVTVVSDILYPSLLIFRKHRGTSLPLNMVNSVHSFISGDEMVVFANNKVAVCLISQGKHTKSSLKSNLRIV